MGQKVHPIGFRLGRTHPHLSKWFAIKKNYSKYLLEDDHLRKTLQKKYSDAKFEKIEISRKTENHLEIVLFAEKPRILVGNRGEKLKLFQQDIKKILQNYRFQENKKRKKRNINLKNKKKAEKVALSLSIKSCSKVSASSISHYLIEFLERRYSYRHALNTLFNQKLKYINLGEEIGIKIQISGRLNGAEIARRTWTREGAGRLPLQTLQAHIDYNFQQAHTIYGVLGVKVWVFKETN